MTNFERITLKDGIINAIFQLTDILKMNEKYPDDEELTLCLNPLVESRLKTIVNNYNELKKEKEI